MGRCKMKIAVIGTGHMGKWFVNELASGHTLAVFDQTPARMRGMGKIQKLHSWKDLSTFAPELLLNAVSIQNTESLFREILPHLPPACILADITSIKGKLPEFYAQCQHPFVSVHPMFGPHFANLKKIVQENFIIVSESNAKGKAFFRSFAKSYKLRIWECSFREHDEMMAYSLTLPFAATITLSGCISGSEVPGTTFAHHLELARKLLLEDDRLLTEILFNAHSPRQLERICSQLEFLKHVIRGQDYEEMKKFLARLRKNIQPHLEKGKKTR